MIASGAGAGSRHSLGTGVFAGMQRRDDRYFFIPLFFRLIALADLRKRHPRERGAAPIAGLPEAR